MQKAYISELYTIMQNDSRVFSLLSDSGTDYDMILAREFPNRCINFGIAEENKVAAASGMAAMGKIPFVYTSGAFLAYRAYEFIRDDICFQDRNVKIIGMGSGLSWSQLGPSHHTTEDIAILASTPNLMLLSPATPSELKKSVRIAYKHIGPVYIRMGMSGESELVTIEYNSETDDRSLDKAIRVLDYEQPDAVVFSTGSIVSESLDAINRLKSENGYNIRLVHLPTIKPLDIEGILQAGKEADHIFTVEEHNINCGIGGLVSAVITKYGECHAPLTQIGLNDCFAIGYGTHKQVLTANRLDSIGIYETVLEVLRKLNQRRKKS